MASKTGREPGALATAKVQEGSASSSATFAYPIIKAQVKEATEKEPTEKLAPETASLAAEDLLQLRTFFDLLDRWERKGKQP